MENTIGDRIRKNRQKRNITQEKLAELCSVSPPTVSRWENGSLNPNREHRRLLSEILRIDFSESEPHSVQSAYPALLQEIIDVLRTMDTPEQELVLSFILDIEKYLNR